jgi:hypothetical protein
MASEIPFLSDAEIHAKVEAFKSSLDSDLLKLPFDAAYVAEVCLRLEPIPLKGLWDDLHIDAALTPDLSGFYVDEESYGKVYEENPADRWRENRLRFSIAHEIGHYVLHRHVVEEDRFRDVEEYMAWRRTHRDFCSPEYQADEFAGKLLVPRENLVEEYDHVCAALNAANPAWRGMEGARNHVAKKIAPRFGVSPQVVEKRLDREGIWSVE